MEDTPGMIDKVAPTITLFKFRISLFLVWYVLTYSDYLSILSTVIFEWVLRPFLTESEEDKYITKCVDMYA